MRFTLGAATALTFCLGMFSALPVLSATTVTGSGTALSNATPVPVPTQMAPSVANPTSVDVSVNTSSGTSPNGVLVHAVGNLAGTSLYSRVTGGESSGPYSYSISATTEYDTSIVGAGPFIFTINPGYVNAAGTPLFVSGDFELASVMFSVTDNGIPIFDATATARVGTSGSTAGSACSGLNATNVFGACNFLLLSVSQANGMSSALDFLGGTFSLPLGTGTNNIVYDITAQASGNVSAGTLCLFSGMSGGGFSSASQGCGADANAGDPLGSPPRAVPLPSTPDLLGIGIVCLALSRLKWRYKNRRVT